MKVYVNDSLVHIFDGSKVGSAVLRYLLLQGQRPQDIDNYIIKDNYDNIVDKEGSLREGSRLYIESTNK